MCRADLLHRGHLLVRRPSAYKHLPLAPSLLLIFKTDRSIDDGPMGLDSSCSTHKAWLPRITG